MSKLRSALEKYLNMRKGLGYKYGRKCLGNEAGLRIVRPLPPALDAIDDFDPARPARLGDVTMDVTMVVSIHAHTAPGSHVPRPKTTCEQDTAYVSG